MCVCVCVWQHHILCVLTICVKASTEESASFKYDRMYLFINSVTNDAVYNNDPHCHRIHCPFRTFTTTTFTTTTIRFVVVSLLVVSSVFSFEASCVTLSLQVVDRSDRRFKLTPLVKLKLLLFGKTNTPFPHCLRC